MTQLLARQAAVQREAIDLAMNQMAFQYRSVIAIRNLAGEWEISEAEQESLFGAYLEEYEGISGKKRLGQA